MGFPELTEIFLHCLTLDNRFWSVVCQGRCWKWFHDVECLRHTDVHGYGLPLYLLIHLSGRSSTYPSAIPLPICPSLLSWIPSKDVCQLGSHSICLSLHQSIDPSVHPSIHPPFVMQSVCTHPCPWVWVSILYPLIHLSGRSSNHPSVHLSIHSFVCLSIHPSVFPLWCKGSAAHRSKRGTGKGFYFISEPIHPFIHPSIHPITLPEPPIYFLQVDLCVHFPHFADNIIFILPISKIL